MTPIYQMHSVNSDTAVHFSLVVNCCDPAKIQGIPDTMCVYFAVDCI